MTETKCRCALESHGRKCRACELKERTEEIILILNNLWDNPPVEGSFGYNTGFGQALGMLKARIQQKYLEKPYEKWTPEDKAQDQLDRYNEMINKNNEVIGE